MFHVKWILYFFGSYANPSSKIIYYWRYNIVLGLMLTPPGVVPHFLILFILSQFINIHVNLEHDEISTQPRRFLLFQLLFRITNNSIQLMQTFDSPVLSADAQFDVARHWIVKLLWNLQPIQLYTKQKTMSKIKMRDSRALRRDAEMNLKHIFYNK